MKHNFSKGFQPFIIKFLVFQIDVFSNLFFYLKNLILVPILIKVSWPTTIHLVGFQANNN
jgi:hypothetical protein